MTDVARRAEANTLKLCLLQKQVGSCFPLDTSDKTLGIGCSKPSRVWRFCHSGDDGACTPLSPLSLTLIASAMFLDGRPSSSPAGYPSRLLGRLGTLSAFALDFPVPVSMSGFPGVRTAQLFDLALAPFSSFESSLLVPPEASAAFGHRP